MDNPIFCRGTASLEIRQLMEELSLNNFLASKINQSPLKTKISFSSQLEPIFKKGNIFLRVTKPSTGFVKLKKNPAVIFFRIENKTKFYATKFSPLIRKHLSKLISKLELRKGLFSYSLQTMVAERFAERGYGFGPGMMYPGELLMSSHPPPLQPMHRGIPPPPPPMPLPLHHQGPQHAPMTPEERFSGTASPRGRRQREFIPENKKDDCYWDRRRRNNEAAKR